MMYYIDDEHNNKRNTDLIDWACLEIGYPENCILDFKMKTMKAYQRGFIIETDSFEDDCKEFTIEINKRLGWAEFAMSILHEMVHAHQMLNGEKLNPNLPYENDPFEVNAELRAKALYERFTLL